MGVARKIGEAIEGIYWQDKVRCGQIVRELDMRTIAKAVDVIAFPTDCEKLLYYTWRTDPKRGYELAAECGVSDLARIN